MGPDAAVDVRLPGHGCLDLDPHIVEVQRMAEWDKLGGPLRAHDAGEDGGLENGAFLGNDLPVAQLGGERGRQHHNGGGVRRAEGDRLAANVDHRGLVLGVEVGEHRDGS